MNRPTTILLIFLLSLPLVTNGRTYLDDENGRISGKVVNKTSESGLSGVTIILFEDGAVKFSTRTDQNGNFSFVNIPAGAYLITAKKNSYSDFAKTIRVNPKFTLKLKLGMESLEQPSRPVLTAVSAHRATPLDAELPQDGFMQRAFHLNRVHRMPVQRPRPLLARRFRSQHAQRLPEHT